MATLEEQAKALAGETINRLLFRLNKIWLQLGREYYPKDNGVAFRNEIFLFADWMLYSFRQGYSDSPDQPNEWITRNRHAFLKLSDVEFMQCIGVSCMHMQAFTWHMHFTRHPAVASDDAAVKANLQAFGKQLDWIYLVHDLKEEDALAAYKLVVDHLGDEENYVPDSKQRLGIYLSKTSLGWSEASSPDQWDVLACAAYMSSWNQRDQDPVQTHQFCEQAFAGF
jgi:hypothetical protein